MKQRLLIALACAVLAVTGCGDDDDKDAAGEEALAGDCAEISEACHHADEGEGAAHDCHELAHANVQTACTAQLDSCTSACAEHP